MKFIILFSIFATAFGQIDHGCQVNCDCPDFTTLFLFQAFSEHNYTKLDGCNFEANCLNGKEGIIRSEWTSSELEKPADTDITFFTINMPAIQDDFMATLGIVCEDGKWFVTKYPIGIIHMDSKENDIQIGSADEYNGKKSQIAVAMW